MKELQSSPDLTIAFVGWNSFQFLHFENVSAKFPGATFLIEERKADARIDDSQLEGSSVKNIVRRDKQSMRKLDGEFDILVCQTPFAGIETITRSKIVSLQYGYAKEGHNFGPWRSFADVCLTFGNYASSKIQPFSPCIAIGNPRYEQWGEAAFQATAKALYATRLNPAKKTVLYAPTWGALSSFGQFAGAVAELSHQYNVIAKLHHNSTTSSHPFESTCGTMDDIVKLLAVSDLLISDFSGSIFDAIYCKVPVILLDPSGAESLETSVSDCYSIERARRDEIGLIVSEPAHLAQAVAETLEHSAERIELLEGLRSELFLNACDASTRARQAILKLTEGKISRSQSQDYVRREMRKYYQCRVELTAARSLGGFFQMISDQARKKLRRS